MTTTTNGVNRVSRAALWAIACALLLPEFTFATPSPRPAPAFPSGEPYPFRAFYPAPSASVGPPALSATIDADLVRLDLAAVEAAKKGAPTIKDRIKRLAHQSERYQAKNRALVYALEAYAKRSTAGPVVADPKLLAQIHAGILFHPVAGTVAESRYDRTENVGFCFGRAALAHLELSRRGIAQSDLIKLFAFGKLRHTEFMWDFHVATAVLAGPDTRGVRRWWVVDTLFDAPLEIKAWIEKVTRFSLYKKNPDTRFYATDPRKFQPITGEYRREDLVNPMFGGYFEDLYRALKAAPPAP